MKQKTVYITGMHCASCDLLIRETIHDTHWVKLISLSESGLLVVDYDDDTNLTQLHDAIIKMGYWMSENQYLPQKKNRKEIFLLALCWALIWWFLYTVDISWYAATLWTDWTLWYKEMIILWWIASLSTCLALVGWFVLMWWSTQSWNNESLSKTVFHQLLFQLWRLWWFAVGWFILWSLWSTLIFSPMVNGVINLLVSILLLVIWWNMLHIFTIHLPSRGWWAGLMKLLNRLATKKRWWVLVWALTFFLPCGFSQLAQINALSTGDPVQGWLLLFVFALGTLPVLFMLWITGNRFQMNPDSFTAKMIWVVLVVLSLFLIQNAFNLLWWF